MTGLVFNKSIETGFVLNTNNISSTYKIIINNLRPACNYSINLIGRDTSYNVQLKMGLYIYLDEKFKFKYNFSRLGIYSN